LGASGASLLEILNNILDFASFESGQVRLERVPFELRAIVDRCLDLSTAGAHANGTELLLKLSDEIPARLIGDPMRLQQVLANLLGNAVKFTRGGKVTLAVIPEISSERIALVRFSVVDTGVGIAPENLERILEPFVQEDAS